MSTSIFQIPTKQQVDARGLALTCSQCNNKARWYGKGCTAYCDECWPGERREIRRESPATDSELLLID